MYVKEYLIWRTMLFIGIASEVNLELLENLVMIQEERGIVMQGIGLVALESEPHFVSAFIKLKNPMADLYSCSKICDVNQDELRKLDIDINGQCEFNVGKTAETSGKVIAIFEIEKVTELLNKYLTIL